METKTYTIDVNTSDGKKQLRVRGETEPQAIMSAYDYLWRQYDGKGEVLETTLKEIA
jgi:hypothetical protein